MNAFLYLVISNLYMTLFHEGVFVVISLSGYESTYIFDILTLNIELFKSHIYYKYFCNLAGYSIKVSTKHIFQRMFAKTRTNCRLQYFKIGTLIWFLLIHTWFLVFDHMKGNVIKIESVSR